MYIAPRGRGFGQTTTNSGWGYISPCGQASGSPSAQSTAAQQQAAAQTMGWIGAAIVGGIVLWGLFGGGGQ